MRLSIWMIANQLTNFEIEVIVGNNSPTILKSARRAYATECVHVYQDGEDVICNGEGNYIRIKDINVEYAFEIVQSIFDTYDDWTNLVNSEIEGNNLQKIVDTSWYIFHNPIVILDAKFKVLAMSNKYENTYVDNEWKYLTENGYSSFEVIDGFSHDEKIRKTRNSTDAQIYRFYNKKNVTNCVSSAIMYDEVVCGRIVILEKDRKLNIGDIQTLNVFVNMITPYINRYCKKHVNEAGYNIFTEMMIGNNFVNSDLTKLLDFIKWNLNDTYQVFYLDSQDEKEILRAALNYITDHVNNVELVTFKNHIVGIFNLSKETYSDDKDIFMELAYNHKIRLGISLNFTNISYLREFYLQAKYAIDNSILSGKKDLINYFYNYSIDFLFESQIGFSQICACNPDIIYLYVNDKRNNGEKLKTLYSYLINDCSPIKASQELFIHKNTLIYRIKKISEDIECSLDEHFSREYLLTSIRLIYLYEKKYNNTLDELIRGIINE